MKVKVTVEVIDEGERLVESVWYEFPPGHPTAYAELRFGSPPVIRESEEGKTMIIGARVDLLRLFVPSYAIPEGET